MRRLNLKDEEKILSLRKEGKILAEIAAMYGVSEQAVWAAAERAKKRKKCKKCHRVVNVEGARFCPFCGEDILSPKEKLIENAEMAAKCGGNDAMRIAIAKLIAFIEAGVEDFE